MDLQAKIRTIPTSAGVYLYKNAEGEIIYVVKAKNLRSRVASYCHQGQIADGKTWTVVRAERMSALQSHHSTAHHRTCPAHCGVPCQKPPTPKRTSARPSTAT